MSVNSKPPFRFWSFFFSPQGRVSQKAIWYFVLPVQGGLLAAQYGIGVMIRNFVRPEEIVHSGWLYANMWVGLTMLIMLWPLFCVMAKRLHDLAVTGAPALLQFVPMVLALGFVAINAFYASRGDFSTARQMTQILGLIRNGVDVCVMLLILFLAFRRGQSGPNHFGADPTGYAAEAVF